MSEELKPCPFCGKREAEVVEDYVASFIMECQFCRATSRRMPTKEAAIKRWNTRATTEREKVLARALLQAIPDRAWQDACNPAREIEEGK